MISPGGELSLLEPTDNKNGSYSLLKLLTVTGDYRIRLILRGLSVQNGIASLVEVIAASTDPLKCDVDASSTLFARYPEAVVVAVVTRDAWGNAIAEGQVSELVAQIEIWQFDGSLLEVATLDLDTSKDGVESGSILFEESVLLQVSASSPYRFFVWIDPYCCILRYQHRRTDLADSHLQHRSKLQS